MTRSWDKNNIIKIKSNIEGHEITSKKENYKKWLDLTEVKNIKTHDLDYKTKISP
jgi:hypothetical protein